MLLTTFPPLRRERCSPVHSCSPCQARRPANQCQRWWPREKPRAQGVTPGQYASNSEGDDDGKNHRYAENHVFRQLLIKRVGVGKERGGGHTVSAREGQQWGQGPRPCSREGARGPTLSALYYDYLLHCMYYLTSIYFCFSFLLYYFLTEILFFTVIMYLNLVIV